MDTDTGAMEEAEGVGMVGEGASLTSTAGSKEKEGSAVSVGTGSINRRILSAVLFLMRVDMVALRDVGVEGPSIARYREGEHGSEGFKMDEEKAGKRGV